MATQNSITVGVNVTDNGTTKQVHKSVKDLHSELKSTQQTAKSLGSSVTGTGGTTGSRRALQAAYGGAQGMTGEQYGNLRGSASVTGASARDFANQAQGLGGVVRLYATLAANIFAVGAAFNALRSAMDTANLIKGLDQLGAVSGVALGSLSKRLSDVTDGAISTREAMESVAKASSSGMSSENILRMGKVAKQAAQALGVDMADAVNRLTRGITKLEPELLDELGIFTKVDKATQDYAKSIGVSASSLTDFERRMAFANAVLEEGERKFSAIDFETNPYTKLLATLKDVAYVGLNLVNTVLGPLAKFLAASPTALGAVITALGTVLVKQALPALGQLRAGLQDASDQALKTAKDFKERFGDEFQGRLEAMFRIPDLEANVRKAEAQLKGLKFEGKKPASLMALQAGDMSALTKVQSLLETRNKTIETGMSGSRKASEARIAELKKEATYIQSVIDLQKGYIQAQQVADRPQGRLDPEVIAYEKYMQLRRAAARSEAISNAAQNAQIVGITGSWRLLNKEIAEKGITGIEKYTTRTLGGLAAIGSRAAQVIGAFGQVGMVIAAIGAAFMFVDGILSKNAKQMSEFSKSADLATESTDNLSRTLKAIDKKPFGEQLSTESLKALATALNETASSLSDLIDKTQDARKATIGIWDKSIDSLKGIFGADLQSKAAKALTENVLGSLNLIADSEEAKKAKATIAGILEIDPDANTKAWREAFENITDNKVKLKEVEAAMKGVAKASLEAAFNAEKFDNALKAGRDAYKQFVASYKVKDDFSALAMAILDTGAAIGTAFKTPEQALARLAELTKNIDNLALFGPEDQANLLKYSELIQQVNTKYEQQLAAIKETQRELDQLNKPKDTSENILERTVLLSPAKKFMEFFDDREITKKAEEAQQRLAKQQAQLDQTRKQAAEIAAKFPEMSANQLARGADLLSKSISASLAVGSTKLQEAVLGVLAGSDVEGAAAARGKLEESRLKQEAALIQSRFSLLNQEQQLLIDQRIFAEKERKELADADVRQLRMAGASTSEASKRAADAEAELAKLEKLRGLYKTAAKDPQAALAEITGKAGEGFKLATQDAKTFFEYVQNRTGLIIAQRANGDAQQANAFNTQIAKIKEIEGKQKRIFDNEIGTTQQKLKNLELLEQENGYLTEAQILEKSTLQDVLAKLSYSKEVITTNAQIQALELAYANSQGEITKESFEATRKILLDKLEINRVDNLEVAAGSRRLSTEKAIAESVEKQILQKRRLLDLEREITDLETSTTLELERLRLEYDEGSGKVSARALEERKASLEIRQAEVDSAKRLQSAERSREDKLNQLKTKYSEEQRQQMLDEQLLIETQYELEVSATKEILELRKQITAQKLRDSGFLGQLESTLKDSIATALFEGGKAGGQKLKDFLKNSFRKFVIDMYINPIVGNFMGQLQGMLGGTGSAVGAGALSGGSGGMPTFSSMAGTNIAAFGNFIGSAATSAFGTGMSLGTTAAADAIAAYEAAKMPEIASSLKLGAEFKAYADTVGTALSYLNALNMALSGDYGAGIGAAIGTYFGGPIGGYIGGKIGSALGWTDSSGTYHSGGVGAYSAAGGRMEGQPANLAVGFGISPSEMRAEANKGAAEMSKATVQMLDSFATSFGKEAGYFVGTGFADDTSADGAWGALLIKRGNEVLKNWGRGRDKWPGREFANAEAGVQQYQAAFVKDVRDVMLEVAPAWADELLKEIGDAPTLEQLAGAVGSIESISKAMINLGKTLPNFANLTDDAISALLRMTGGIENLISASNAYYEAFYTEEEKLAKANSEFTSVMRKLGLSVPSTRMEFRKLVEAQNLNTEAGRNMYAVLMSLAPAFLEITEAVEAGTSSLTTAEEKLKQVYDNRKAELEDLISVWDRVSTGLTSFITSLRQGAQSTLTPAQKFELAQQEYTAAIRALRDPATDPKERAKLAENFQALSTTLLDSSRMYMASGQDYSRVFDTVLADSQQLASEATSLATGFKTELSALNTMAEQLGIIQQEATQSTDFLAEIDSFYRNKFGAVVAEAVYAAYSTYQGRSGFGTGATNIDIPGFEYWAANVGKISTEFSSIPARAAGGYTAPGLTLVGEEGPELVNFKTPGMVYSADKTNDILQANGSNQALVAEVRALRQEVVKLREQQRTETGHLINATYDAQNRNAETVTEGIDSSLSKQAWADKVRKAATIS